jgi:hypothetical protein
MKIVVGGYIVSYPLGGMTWHHLNYLLGLKELGHELFFLEDGGDWLLPYLPHRQRVEADSSFGRAYLERTFRSFGLSIPWCYYLAREGTYFGSSERELHDAMRNADLMICVSGVTAMRPDRPRPTRTLVIGRRGDLPLSQTAVSTWPNAGSTSWMVGRANGTTFSFASRTGSAARTVVVRCSRTTDTVYAIVGL